MILKKRFKLTVVKLELYIGLPPSGSWQDLKDHMREAGDVCFADAYKDGTGCVEFLRYEVIFFLILMGWVNGASFQ